MEIQITNSFEKIARNLISRLFNLKDKWADERQYEDFVAYQKIVKEWVEAEGGEFVSLNKNFHLKIKAGREHCTIKLWTSGKWRIIFP